MAGLFGIRNYDKHKHDRLLKHVLSLARLLCTIPKKTLPKKSTPYIQFLKTLSSFNFNQNVLKIYSELLFGLAN